jgi:hypothetical protein
VIGIRQSRAPYPAFTGERDCPFHAMPGIQIARPSSPVPSFHCSETCNQLRFGVDVDQAALNHGEESRESIQAVRVNAIAVGLGKQLSAAAGTTRLEAQLQQRSQESVDEILISDSNHFAVSQTRTTTAAG